MWEPLSGKTLVSSYADSASRIYPYYEKIVPFLRELQSKEYASELFAVTSMGNLHLTTAKRVFEARGHPKIYVSMPDKKKIQLSYAPGVWHGHAKISAQGAFLEIRRAGEFVDLLMIRASYELDMIQLHGAKNLAFWMN